MNWIRRFIKGQSLQMSHFKPSKTFWFSLEMVSSSSGLGNFFGVGGTNNPLIHTCKMSSGFRKRISFYLWKNRWAENSHHNFDRTSGSIALCFCLRYCLTWEKPIQKILLIPQDNKQLKNHHDVPWWWNLWNLISCWALVFNTLLCSLWSFSSSGLSLLTPLLSNLFASLKCFLLYQTQLEFTWKFTSYLVEGVDGWTNNTIGLEIHTKTKYI